MVQRLGQYKWSSYGAYAYAEPKHEWLETSLVLSQVSGVDKHQAYRKKVQGYSGEEKKMLENIHLGLVTGTKKFAKSIKEKYLPDDLDCEILQQKPGIEDYDIDRLIKKASEIIKCDIDEYKKARRVNPSDKITNH